MTKSLLSIAESQHNLINQAAYATIGGAVLILASNYLEPTEKDKETYPWKNRISTACKVAGYIILVFTVASLFAENSKTFRSLREAEHFLSNIEKWQGSIRQQ